MRRKTAKPPRHADLPDLCTPEQAQAFLQVSRNGIYSLIKSESIKAVKFGRLIRIPKDALVGR